MLPFNKPPITGNEEKYILQALQSAKLSGDGYFGQKSQSWFEQNLGAEKTLLTTSCTHALEMAAILIDIRPGDEVIMPSYTFVSTANAFVLRGATIVFVDIRPDTMNMDETRIEAAITEKTKAIVPVHYAGVACEMDKIMHIASQHDIYVIEDAAQGITAKYKNKTLGTMGQLATYSFHETKNVSSGGEGGLLIINDKKFIERAEIIREKGTNRSRYFRGMTDKYSWVDIGSSYLPSELQAAYLWGQLEMLDMISQARMNAWKKYHARLKTLEDAGFIELPTIPADVTHNAHMFYIKVKDLSERTAMIEYMDKSGIMSVFHYVPLHSSPAGKIYTRFYGEDNHTTRESERLLRLPMFYGITDEEIKRVTDSVMEFFN